MRHPVFAGFAILSFIGLTAFAAACAKSEDPSVDGILQTQNPTDPDDGGTKSAKIPPKSNPTTPKPVGTVPPPVDAGPADTGAPPAGDDDDDVAPDCPQDTAHLLSWSLASSAGGTECTSGGDECTAATECCFVYPIPGLGKNYCLPQ